MEYSLRTDNLTLTDVERDALDKKLRRLQKHLQPPFTTDVTLLHDSHHLKGDVVTCRINIKYGKKVFHAERVGSTIADVVDESVRALDQELAKHHSKQKDKH